MSQLYPGYAPLTVILPGTGSPGVIVSSGAADPHGIWPTPLEMTGGDKRFAVNLNLAMESLTSRTNWIGWRTIDWIRGGDYSAWTAQVSLNSLMLWGGSHTFNGSILITVGATWSGTAQLNGGASNVITWNGTAHFNLLTKFGGSGTVHVENGTLWQFDSGSSVNAESPISHIGATAVNVLRESGLPFPADTSDHFDPSILDLVRYDSSAITGPRIWTLDAPASGGCVTVLFYPTPGVGTLPSFTVTIEDSGGAAVTTIASGALMVPFRLYYTTIGAPRWIKII